jgi:hypothetical protein
MDTTTPRERPVDHFEVSVFLDSGVTLEFIADTISTSRSPVDGRLTSMKWEGTPVASGAPLYLDLDHVIAVMTKAIPA